MNSNNWQVLGCFDAELTDESRPAGREYARQLQSLGWTVESIGTRRTISRDSFEELDPVEFIHEMVSVVHSCQNDNITVSGCVLLISKANGLEVLELSIEGYDIMLHELRRSECLARN